MKDIMTIEELEKGQEEIEREIYEYAKSKCISNENIEPITDGIYSPEEYLKSVPRVMWVLKEPYDKIDESENPYGEGWSIPKDCYDEDDAWKNRTWQPMIYSMYGLYNKLTWEEMDLISDNRNMTNILKQIAYINISKIPALTNSSQYPIEYYYQTWRHILLKQIKLYKPNVIIFGSTIDYFWKDLIGKAEKAIKQYIKDGIYYLNAYKKDDILLLDTYHPTARLAGFNRGDYVNIVINAINELI